MPSPIGHSLLGCGFYTAFRSSNGHDLKLIGLCLFAANAADMDFVPGLLIGDPNRFHHGISHSLGVAVLFATACSAFRLMGPSFWSNVGFFFSLYFSHVAIDYFSIDNGFPYGVMVFWPLTNEYYIAPFAFLPDIRRSSMAGEFFESLFTLHNLWAVTVESILISPILLVIWAVKKPFEVVELSIPQPPPTDR
jgi:inner membrane protein